MKMLSPFTEDWVAVTFVALGYHITPLAIQFLSKFLIHLLTAGLIAFST